MKIARKYIAPVSLLLISTIVTVYGATLFTQTFPAVSTVTLTAKCSTLTASAAPATGSSGSIAFDCSGTSPFGTTVAFVESGGLSLTPTFTLPSVYTDLSIYRPGAIPPSTSPCSSFLFSSPLTSNTAISSGSGATGDGTTDYCADFTSVPSTGLPTFTITWTTNAPVLSFHFTQTFPSTTGVAAAAQCSTLNADATAAVVGSSGVIAFDCSSSAIQFGTTPAFIVTAGSTLTPTFVLTGTGYTALAVISPSTVITSCTGSSITSGSPVLLSQTSYDYCATFTNAPSTAFGMFTVSWS